MKKGVEVSPIAYDGWQFGAFPYSFYHGFSDLFPALCLSRLLKHPQKLYPADISSWKYSHSAPLKGQRKMRPAAGAVIVPCPAGRALPAYMAPSRLGCLARQEETLLDP